MPQPIDLDFERLKRLPVRPDVWQLAIVRMPQWVVEEGHAPFRPLVPMCLSTTLHRLGTGGVLEPGEPSARPAIAAIAGLARLRDVLYRPTRVEVLDPALVEALRADLATLGIELALVERLNGIDEAVDEMREGLEGAEASPVLLAGLGVGLERVRAFADAAAAFHRAAPWNHLTDEDLLRVESPVPEEGLRCLTVLGAGGIERGIGFYRSAEDFGHLLDERTSARFMLDTRLWFFGFERIHELAIADSELWETHGLPVAQEDAYPTLLCHVPHGTTEPADGARLTFAEALLRALAASTEDDLDSGRWSKTVTTFEGERTVELSIPALLEPPRKSREPAPGEAHELPDRRLMERTMLDLQRAMAGREFTDIEEAKAFLAELGGMAVPHSPATGPAGQAQELFYAALEAQGRMRIKLAREALKVDPDCADAWGLLAEEMPDLSRRADLYGKAVEAAARTLGDRPFQEDVGHFWGLLETRPYMRARLGYAECLWSADRREEALAEMTDLLRLNPSDNLGVRHLLVPRLLELQREDEAARVLAAYEKDGSPFMAYARLLAELRRGGAGEAVERALTAALRSNPHVPKYLLGGGRLPEPAGDSYRPGSDEEAVLAAESLRKPWQETPGAVNWLRESRKRAKKAREQKRGKGRGTRR